MESITTEVTGKVSLPAGGPAGADAAEPPVKGFTPIASKPFFESDPKIQVLIGLGIAIRMSHLCVQSTVVVVGGGVSGLLQASAVAVDEAATLLPRPRTPPHTHPSNAPQELVRSVLRLYNEAPFSSDAGHRILDPNFVYNGRCCLGYRAGLRACCAC